MSNELTEVQNLRETQLQHELEALKNKNLELEKLVAESAPLLEKIEREREEQQFTDSILQAAAEAGLEPSLGLKQKDFANFLKIELNLDRSSDGTPYVTSKSGRVLDFATAAQELALANQYMFSEQSIKRLKKPNHELTKADLSTAQKVQYIKTFGPEKFEALPNLPKRPMPSLATITAAQYMSLSVPERIAVSKRVGESGISEILKRK